MQKIRLERKINFPAFTRGIARNLIWVSTIFFFSAGYAYSSEPDNSGDPGKTVVTQVCSACHLAGLMGAPKIGDKSAWGPRFARDGGVDGLATIAKHGKGNMPARGGQPSLTDDQIKAAITYMLKQSQVL